MIKKLTAVLLSAVTVLSLSSCRQSTAETTRSADFRLPYSSSDTFNPFESKTDANHALDTLIFESLFTINQSCAAKCSVAKNYVREDLSITVNLRALKFSDRSELTSADVVYSFNRAKNSERYADSLKNFSRAERKGSSVVRFTLDSPDIYAVNLLTFPIVSSENPSVGSGRYFVSKDAKGTFLEYNKISGSVKPKIEKICLVDCQDYNNAVNMLNNGKIDFVFDPLESGNIRSATGKSIPGMMNHLIFLGINSKKSTLKNADFRKGLAEILDQKSIAEEAFNGYAYATATPFKPNWGSLGSIVANSTQARSREAKDAVLNAGYEYDSMGISLMKGDKQVTLTLIVNSANNMKVQAAEAIKTQLINFGIDVEIKKMPLDEYTVAVENGNFDLYIGEVIINNNFDLDCFFTDNGGATFGINSPTVCASYAAFKQGKATLQSFVTSFSDENPFIPICYKGADVCYSTSLEGNVISDENDIYYNIGDWSY